MLDTIFHIKRLIGRDFDDPFVQEDIKYLPFKVLKKNNKPVIVSNTSFGEKSFTPEEISAMILGKMRQTAVFIYFILYRMDIISSFFVGEILRYDS